MFCWVFFGFFFFWFFFVANWQEISKVAFCCSYVRQGIESVVEGHPEVIKLVYSQNGAHGCFLSLGSY